MEALQLQIPPSQLGPRGPGPGAARGSEGQRGGTGLNWNGPSSSEGLLCWFGRILQNDNTRITINSMHCIITVKLRSTVVRLHETMDDGPPTKRNKTRHRSIHQIVLKENTLLMTRKIQGSCRPALAPVSFVPFLSFGREEFCIQTLTHTHTHTRHTVTCDIQLGLPQRHCVGWSFHTF